MTEAPKPVKKTKAELEELIKANGGSVVASEKDANTILIADRNLIKVASATKRNDRNIIRPQWLLDCIKQNESDLELGRPTLLLPLEPQHIFHVIPADFGNFDYNVDEFGDSYTRDVTADDLLTLFNKMPAKLEQGYGSETVLDQVIEHGHELDAMMGWMFHGITAYFDCVPAETVRLFEFAGGLQAESLEQLEVTHVVVKKGTSDVRNIRKNISSHRQLPRVVTDDWVSESWAEGSRLDEERFAHT